MTVEATYSYLSLLQLRPSDGPCPFCGFLPTIKSGKVTCAGCDRECLAPIDIDADILDRLPKVCCRWSQEANDTRPAWTRGRTLWSEDDAKPPDRERLDEAWERLFGEKLSEDDSLAVWDGGDSLAYLEPGGRVFWSTYQGEEITLRPPTLITGHEKHDRWNLGE
jgi:hypothetical protein